MKHHKKNEEWHKIGVTISADVDLSRIADDVTLHPGCRITGKETSIGPGSILGAEAPVSLENCQLGRNVNLKGGSFSHAAFFDDASMGSGAQVRAGTLLEEEANGAHSVGLKQTILFPFVTLGSLINFCDILMAGGTSRKDHGEVGSSYVHFNYTPHQDKATASLLGDVAQGVFLDRNPIFLGGQGGLVGPSQIAYGTVIAAGGVCREDVQQENQLLIPMTPEAGTRNYETGTYHSIDRIVRNNLLYIGNIVALQAWYKNARSLIMCRDEFDKACLDGGIRILKLVLEERIKRLGGLAANMERSFIQLEKQSVVPEKWVLAQRNFFNAWEAIEFELLQNDWKSDEQARDSFLVSLATLPVGGTYTDSIKLLEPEVRKTGSQWLQSIVNEVVKLWPAQRL
jgi:hypothetical protein